MKKILLSLFTALSVSAMAQGVVINDENAEKRNIAGSFTAIKVSNGIELVLTQGDEESVVVSAARAEYLQKFKTIVENGTLKIYLEKSDFNWINTGKRKLRAYVSFTTLKKIQGSSGAQVTTHQAIKAGELEMDFSSGASFNGEVEATALQVEQNSGGEVKLKGKADKLTVSVNSGAIFQGYDFVTQYCDARASSGAGIRILVTKEINASANSGAAIKFKGDAGIKELSVNSGGSVKRVS
ncbi:MAG TPA: head GIN domain-containing protein [Ferruginibacter sp.]|nr:head GIN domain-containing protein [Ferruginibacter sp.]HMP22036.1 head GIN domain-containing protein [Ferruginibacter sp.]